jgi:RHS repeat-associated protein
VRYLHLDRLGSVDAVTVANGTEFTDAHGLVDAHGFDAFGRPRSREWQPSNDQMHPNGESGTTTNHGFTGHEQLDETFLTHMNGRVYDYRLGRFLSVDPIIGDPASSQSINPYSYGGNNPLSGVDPTGYFFTGGGPGGDDKHDGLGLCGHESAPCDSGRGTGTAPSTHRRNGAKSGSGGTPANSPQAPSSVNTPTLAEQGRTFYTSSKPPLDLTEKVNEDTNLNQFFPPSAGGPGGPASVPAENNGNYHMGPSTIVANLDERWIGIYDQDGTQMYQARANNRTDHTSNGPWPPGTYDFVRWHPHGPGDNGYGENNKFGLNGAFEFSVPGRSYMEVHAGQADKGGPDHWTFGCVRTTDEFTAYMHDAHFNGFPIQKIIILPRGNGP